MGVGLQLAILWPERPLSITLSQHLQMGKVKAPEKAPTQARVHVADLGVKDGD